jgi:pimeloyl-ACP methyl ester carboxylesterase
VGEFAIDPAGARLSGDDEGEGTPVVLLHGLTASRRYVVMGSKHLERSGHRVVAYDARGHGRSSPGDGYAYEHLVGDLCAVLDAAKIDRAVLAGASMGAHTILRLALEHPERVLGLVVITPAHDPADFRDTTRLARWDALADGLARGGIDGFVAAYRVADLPSRWRETAEKVLRQRLAAHEHLGAVADALRAVPRSAPFAELADLEAIRAPSTVVGSRDEADPGHPFALAQAYARALPGAVFRSEEEGSSPLAWQGGRLSKVIAEVATRAARRV